MSDEDIVLVDTNKWKIIDTFPSITKAKNFGNDWLEEQYEKGNKDAQYGVMKYKNWLKQAKIYFPKNYANGGTMMSNGGGVKEVKTWDIFKDNVLKGRVRTEKKDEVEIIQIFLRKYQLFVLIPTIKKHWSIKLSDDKFQFAKGGKMEHGGNTGLKIGNYYSVKDAGDGEFRDDMEYLGYSKNEDAHIFRHMGFGAPGNNNINFMYVEKGDEKDMVRMEHGGNC